MFARLTPDRNGNHSNRLVASTHADMQSLKSTAHQRQSSRALLRMDDPLGDHGVIVGRDRGTGLHKSVDAHAGTLGRDPF